MAFLKRTRLGLSVVAVVTGTAFVFGSGRELPQATGKAPPIPKAGPLARPRSLDQVGLPAEPTRTVIPRDNPQTPDT
jgi:cytochrome c peroxidase